MHNLYDIPCWTETGACEWTPSANRCTHMTSHMRPQLLCCLMSPGGGGWMEACTHAATPTHTCPPAFACCAEHATSWTYTCRVCRYMLCACTLHPCALSMSRQQAHTHTSPVQQAGAGAIHSVCKSHACCHTGRHCSPRSPPDRAWPLHVDKMPHAASKVCVCTHMPVCAVDIRCLCTHADQGEPVHVHTH